MFVKKINIALLVFSILCLFVGSGYMYSGINYLTQVDGIAEAIVGGFLFLSGTLGLCIQVFIHNQN